MKTSKFNGNNVSQLEFDYFIRYRPRHDVYIPGMEKQIKKLFREMNYEYICYSWEQDEVTTSKHSHCLVKTGYNKDKIVDKLKNNISSTDEPVKGTREVIYTTEQNLINPKTGEEIKKLVEKKDSVDYIEVSGKYGSVFIEDVKDKKSASFYAMKLTDYGANFGYIQG